MSKKSFVIGVLFLAAAGAAGWHLINADSHDAIGKKQAAFVTVAPVVQKDVPLELSAVGSVVPYQSVTIHSRLDTQIIDVKFHSGDYVNQGDLLFQLDDRTIKAQIQEQQSNLARDRAQEENLKLQFERRKKLVGRGYETPENLEIAKAAYEAQAATVAATAAALQNLQVQLEFTRITAPISGRTGTVSLTAGNTVKANDLPLVVINQVKPIWVQFSLPQHVLDNVRQAKAAGPVAATAQHEGGKLVAGALDYIDNAVDSTTGTFAVRALFDNEDESLWPGMFANTTLKVGEEKDALTVPEVAIQHGPDGDYVFVIEQGKAQHRAVKVALIQKDEVIISDGLKAGEQVAIDGMMKIEDGGAVEIAPTTAPAPAAAESKK